MWLALGCVAVVPSGSAPEPADSGERDDIEQVGGGEDEPPVDPTDAVFDLTRVHTIELTMDAAAWADVRDNPGVEAWYVADVDIDGERVDSVGIRAFGAGSEIAGKPPLKLSFDRFIPQQRWRGLEQLKLDNSSQDAGYLNEAIGTGVLRAMGLPAARTGWANVLVNGVPAGFFVVLEAIDDRFLKRHFGNADGPLYGTWDWRYGQGLNLITWGTPLDWYVPQTSVETDGSDIAAAVNAVNYGTEEEFHALVDVDEFTKVAVTRAAIGAIDAYAADGNNFYLYDDGGQFRLVPWDLDADLGYPYYFQNALVMDLYQPWLTSHARYNPVTGTVYSDPVHARAMAEGWDVEGWLDALLDGPLAWETVSKAVRDEEAVIHDSACADVIWGCAAHEQRVADLLLFLHSRLSRLAGGEVAACGGGTELSVSGTVGYGSIGVDATEWGPGMMINGRHYCSGVLACAPSVLTTTVPAGQLKGSVGLHDLNAACGDGAAFSIVQNGLTLWESGVTTQYRDAIPFSVQVDAGDIVLQTSAGGSIDCDWAVWASIRVE